MQLTETHKMIQTTARQFAIDRLLPNATFWDQTETFPLDAIRGLGELGFLGMLVPEQDGGAGLDCLSYVLAVEEIAAGDASCSTIMSVNNSIFCLPILHYGNTLQKEKFLAPCARGEWIGAFGLTEPGAGSDMLALQANAIRENNEYILNGVKQFVTSGKNAKVLLVFAVTDPNPNARDKRLSAFLVPTDSPGYRVGRLEKKLGQRASDTAEIILENVRIPVEYRLGKEGEGHEIAVQHLMSGRVGIAAQCVGIARAAFEAAHQYALTRVAFQKPLIKHQSIAFRLADMATQIEAARALVWAAADAFDHHQRNDKLVAMAKLFASEMVEKVCSDAIQIHGGYGYLVDFTVERLYRDARVTQIYEGTNEVQRMVISRGL